MRRAEVKRPLQDALSTGTGREDAPAERMLVGTRSVYLASRDGQWLVDFIDAGMRKVLDDPSVEEFAWSPDGYEVAFHSRRDGTAAGE